MPFTLQEIPGVAAAVPEVPMTSIFKLELSAPGGAKLQPREGGV